MTLKTKIKERTSMLYPFMTLNDNTEIVHSELLNMDGKEKVRVCIEKPVYGGFNSVPESLSHIIIQLAKDGGIDGGTEYAANF